jgi:hypothetical protein
MTDADRFPQRSGLGARLAVAAMGLSILSGMIGFIGGQYFAESLASRQAPDRLLIQGAVALVIQVAIVLGLRSSRRASRVVAEAAAGLGGLFLLAVSLFIGGELAREGAPMWLWPRFALLVTSGLLYITAATLAWREGRHELPGQPGPRAAS